MTRISHVGLVVLGMLIAASPAAAQTDSARILDLLKDGQKIVVIDDDGREMKGRVRELSGSKLGLEMRDGRRDIPLDSIVKIDHPHDGLGNGALIGASTVVGLTLVSAAIVHRSCDPSVTTCSDPPPAWVWAWIVGSSAAGGAGIGVAIDAMIRRDPAIYRRGSGPRTTIRPAVGPGVRGAMVTISW